MGLFNSIRMGSSAAGDYEIKRSLRCNPDDGTYLEATPSAAGSNQMTFSFWMKRSNPGGGAIFSSGTTDARGHIFFSSDKLAVQPFNSSGANAYLITDMVLKDCSAWYHVVISCNNTAYNDMASTVNIYINGVAATFTTSVTGTPTGGNRLNDSQEKRIGEMRPDSGSHFDGYLAEFNFIDGQVLDASSFGETNALTGQWIPKKYEGTYGTEGFYLNFSDNSGTTATTLGKDTSGQSNNWTPYNFSTADSVIDSPTNNFCTGNPNGRTYVEYVATAYTPIFSEGALEFETGGNSTHAYGTIAVNPFLTTGCYFELLINDIDNARCYHGIVDAQSSQNDASYGFENKAVFHRAGHIYNSTQIDGTNDYSSGVSITNGDIVGVAVKGTSVWFHKNGTWINNSSGSAGDPSAGTNAAITAITDIATKHYLPYAGYNTDWTFNFGQDSTFGGEKTAQGNTDANGIGDFYYSVPTGFVAMCTANMPEPSILLPNKHFDSLLWTGDNSSRNITGLEFDPDFVWAKNRTIAYSPEVYDIVRGNNKRIFPDSQNLEVSNGALSFGVTGGFALSAGGSLNDDDGTNDIVAWNWKGGGSASSNGDGSLTSSVSANTTAGFSIVSWTSTGTTGSTIGHGLGVKPDVIILKSRDTSSNQPWRVYHSYLGATKSLMLDATDAAATQTGVWNDTEPTSSVFTVGSFGSTNENTKNYIAYCFSEVAGYSKFGYYIGNGQSAEDGTFLYLGFRPAFVLIKRTDAAENWWLYDIKRDPYNPMTQILYGDLNNVEISATGNNISNEFYSNGIKFITTNANWNAAGGKYIYMAFAESPFKYARAR